MSYDSSYIDHEKEVVKTINILLIQHVNTLLQWVTIRHTLITRRKLSKLWNIPPDTTCKYSVAMSYDSSYINHEKEVVKTMKYPPLIEYVNILLQWVTIRHTLITRRKLSKLWNIPRDRICKYSVAMSYDSSYINHEKEVVKTMKYPPVSFLFFFQNLWSLKYFSFPIFLERYENIFTWLQVIHGYNGFLTFIFDKCRLDLVAQIPVKY